MGPFVLILSYGSENPIDIIHKIHTAKKSSIDLSTPQDLKIGETTLSSYKYKIKNKYFETDIKLIPFEEPLASISNEILKQTEAVIVAFDCSDKSFLSHIPKLCEVIQNNNIELGLLLTTKLYDDCNEGLSYADIKEICTTTFDVIDTNNKDDDNDDDKDENVENYSEVIEALENHVWSNVATASPTGSKKESTAEQPTEDFDEEQLEAYEHLLTNIVNFKANTANLNRDQVLDQAEKLAQMFSNFMGDD